jgi:hypothetical protein
MKKFLLLLPLTLCLLGCPSTITTPTPPLAPGYTSPIDQQFGQALAAARALANQAVTNYAFLSRSQQLAEKNALNALSSAVNVADDLYAAYHAGQASPAQVQDALTQVNVAQTAFTNVVIAGWK